MSTAITKYTEMPEEERLKKKRPTLLSLELRVYAYYF